VATNNSDYNNNSNTTPELTARADEAFLVELANT
jgi:hypothetical protein